MTLLEIFEKDKGEHARSLAKHGPWTSLHPVRQVGAILAEAEEWYQAYLKGDVAGEHGEIVELIHLRNCCARRIMALTGERQ